jgi:Flp pilus assembly protein TadG
MRRRPFAGSRRAVSLVECAVVYPTVLLLLLGLAVGGAGIFRYQEVASLAREAARYGSTHGAQYRQDAGLATGDASAWTTDIYTNALAPNIVALDSSALSYTVTWPTVINQSDKSDNWPGSTVTVTISYQWFPEVYLVGPLTLTSTSSMPITN